MLLATLGVCALTFSQLDCRCVSIAAISSARQGSHRIDHTSSYVLDLVVCKSVSIDIQRSNLGPTCSSVDQTYRRSHLVRLKMAVVADMLHFWMIFEDASTSTSRFFARNIFAKLTNVAAQRCISGEVVFFRLLPSAQLFRACGARQYSLAVRTVRLFDSAHGCGFEAGRPARECHGTEPWRCARPRGNLHSDHGLGQSLDSRSHHREGQGTRRVHRWSRRTARRTRTRAGAKRSPQCSCGRSKSPNSPIS